MAKFCGSCQFDFENLIAITFAVAIRTAQIDIAEKLHFHMFKAIARTGRATAFAGIKTENPRRIFALLSRRVCHIEFAYGIKSTDISRRY